MRHPKEYKLTVAAAKAAFKPIRFQVHSLLKVCPKNTRVVLGPMLEELLRLGDLWISWYDQPDESRIEDLRGFYRQYRLVEITLESIVVTDNAFLNQCRAIGQQLETARYLTMCCQDFLRDAIPGFGRTVLGIYVDAPEIAGVSLGTHNRRDGFVFYTRR
jgi:hypothetical protein